MNQSGCDSAERHPARSDAGSPPSSGAGARAVLRGAMQVGEALCGAYYDWVSPDLLRSTNVEGLFPPLSLMGRYPVEPARSRASWVAGVFRGEDVAVQGTWLGSVLNLGRADIVTDAAQDPRLPQHSDPALRAGSLMAIATSANGRVGGVIVLAHPVGGGVFTPAAATAVTQWLAGGDAVALAAKT